MVRPTMECGCPETYPSGLVFWAVPCDYCKAAAGSPCVYVTAKYGSIGQPCRTPHSGRKDAHLAAVHRSVQQPVTVGAGGELKRGGVPVFSSPEEADAWLEQQADDAGTAAEGSQDGDPLRTCRFLNGCLLGHGHSGPCDVPVPRVPDVLLVSVHTPAGQVLYQSTIQRPKAGDTVGISFTLP